MITEIKMCAFYGCPNEEHSRGWCFGHYSQQRKGKELTPLRVYKTVNRSRRDKAAEAAGYVEQVSAALGRSKRDASIWLWLHSNIDHHMWLMKSVEVDDWGCWIWQGKKEARYGKARALANLYLDDLIMMSAPAYRVSFALEHGFDALPAYDRKDKDPLTLDHLCQKPLCIHPHHLEVVPDSENRKRHHQMKNQEDYSWVC